jgi:crotonobetainyl-CoA:carnitine CoA-transferase CaiB-like acyl-CoA transferase
VTRADRPASEPAGRRGALDGVRVLELGHGIAAPFAARLLGDLGAEVVKLEKPGTGDLARRLPPLDADAPEPERSLLFQYLNWNKRSVALDLGLASSHDALRRWVEGSDIVFESFVPGTLERWGIGIERLLEWNPRLVLVSVSNFGRSGPYAGYAASDLVLQAMSGIMHISGRVDRPPLKHGLAQSAYCAGLNAAYVAIAALVAAEADGIGEHVDLSMHECLASELVMSTPYYAFMGAVQGRRAPVQDPFQGEPIPTRKGYLAVQSGAVRFEKFAELFGRAEFRTPEYTQRVQRNTRVAEVRAVLESCVADRDAKEIFLEGARMRLLLGVVQGAPELLQCEQLAARGVFASVARPAGGRWKFPAEFAKLSATPVSVRRPAPRLGEHGGAEAGWDARAPQPPAAVPADPARGARLPLAGLRVIDLSYVFAVPYMAALMSDLGAEVIKIEGPHRLDQTRSGAFGPHLDNDPGTDPWNRSGSFHVLNRGKRSLLLDLSGEEGRDALRKMVRDADFVLENYTPRVLRDWGLDHEALREINPALIMLSNTGYGATGPWSSFPSQGTTLEATMGITHYTGYRGDKPWKVGQSYPDFLACWSGLTALFAALRHRRRSGEGQWIDLGMYQLGAVTMPEPLLQWQLDGCDPQRIGNEHALHVPSNLYPAQGVDQWVAITVSSDAQWRRLAARIGLDGDRRLECEAGRREQRALIDEAVANWTARQEAWAVTRLLQAEGIASGPVLNNRDLLLDPQLRQRGFYEAVEHPLPVGLRPIIGRPYRMRNRRPRIQRPAPRLGEHGHAALREMFGFSEHELARVRAGASAQPTTTVVPGALDMQAALQSRTVTALDADYRQRLGVEGRTGSGDCGKTHEPDMSA